LGLGFPGVPVRETVSGVGETHDIGLKKGPPEREKGKKRIKEEKNTEDMKNCGYC